MCVGFGEWEVADTTRTSTPQENIAIQEETRESLCQPLQPQQSEKPPDEAPPGQVSHDIVAEMRASQVAYSRTINSNSYLFQSPAQQIQAKASGKTTKSEGEEDEAKIKLEQEASGKKEQIDGLVCKDSKEVKKVDNPRMEEYLMEEKSKQHLRKDKIRRKGETLKEIRDANKAERKKSRQLKSQAPVDVKNADIKVKKAGNETNGGGGGGGQINQSKAGSHTPAVRKDGGKFSTGGANGADGDGDEEEEDRRSRRNNQYKNHLDCDRPGTVSERIGGGASECEIISQPNLGVPLAEEPMEVDTSPDVNILAHHRPAVRKDGGKFSIGGANGADEDGDEEQEDRRSRRNNQYKKHLDCDRPGTVSERIGGGASECEISSRPNLGVPLAGEPMEVDTSPDENFFAHHQETEHDGLLTAILQGMRVEKTVQVKLAATTALFNYLEFTKANFENESERNYIMQVVCEATQCSDLQVRVAALQCLNKIMSLYYRHMEPYMEPTLFGICVEAMKSQEDSIALQGIKFWSHVCNEEIAIKASEVVEQGRTPENSSRFYAKGALRFLVPILTVLLIAKQEEYDDEDDCNPCKAASVCLKLLAKCCENDIVPLVLPFIHENLVNSDWKFRDAAVMTIESILEGPDLDYLKPHVLVIAIKVIGLLQDESVVVRDTVARTLGRICELLPEAVLNDNSFPMLLEALVQRLDDEPRVAANICRAFISLAKSGYKTALSNINDDSEPLTYCLSTSFQIITSKLIVTTNRPDAQQANLRNAACEALMELVQNSAQDCYPVVKDVSTLVTERIKVILQMESQVQSASDRMQYNDLQSLLCAILQSVLRKMKLEDVQNISEEVMSLLLQMFSRGNMRSGGVQEDVLLVVETLVQVLGTDFIRYVDAFKEYLYAGLENVDEYQVALAVVGLVGDMCRALNTYIMPICDEIMDRLLQNLRNKEVHRSIKPQILSVFGDIAMAIGPNFTIYLNPVLETLQQASQVSQTRVDKTDFDMINYLNELRDGCLKAYTDIVQGLKAVKEDANNGALEVVFNNVPFIILFIEQIASDGNVAACAGLLRDLCSIFTGCVTEYMDRPLIQSILQEGQRSTRQN